MIRVIVVLLALLVRDTSGCSKSTPPPLQPAAAPNGPGAAENPNIRTFTIAGKAMKFVLVEPQTFTMLEGGKYARDDWKWKLRGAVSGGSTGGGPFNQGPPRETTITRPYWTALELVSHKQYQHAMKVSQTDRAGRMIPRDSKYANDLVYQKGAKFCERVVAQDAVKVRMPTEAEWELFARRQEALINKVGPENLSKDELLAPCSRASEWTSDWYERLIDVKERIDPRGPKEGIDRVYRFSVVGRMPGPNEKNIADRVYGEGRGAGIRLIIDAAECR